MGYYALVFGKRWRTDATIPGSGLPAVDKHRLREHQTVVHAADPADHKEAADSYR
ncbi:MAG: hypothetical protein IPK52_22470 [Chloroflexi bacterium]|nr:hypothetical protein [Chloroflexota bacterium]